jgi:hypothetical protein
MRRILQCNAGRVLITQKDAELLYRWLCRWHGFPGEDSEPPAVPTLGDAMMTTSAIVPPSAIATVGYAVRNTAIKTQETIDAWDETTDSSAIIAKGISHVGAPWRR